MLQPAPEHVERGRLALVERHVPVLDPHRLAVHRAVVLADVAGGEDARLRGLEPGRAPHAALLAELEAGRACASVTSGITPMPATTKSQSSSRPAFVTTFVTRSPSPSKRSSSWPPCTFTPCSSSTSWKKRPTFSPKNGSKVTSSIITICALHPVRRGERRRHLAADVAAADQHGPLAALGIRADRVRVAEGAQVVDPVEVAAVHPQPLHVRAGGEQRAARTRSPPWSRASRRAPRCRASSRSSA